MVCSFISYKTENPAHGLLVGWHLTETVLHKYLLIQWQLVTGDTQTMYLWRHMVSPTAHMPENKQTHTLVNKQHVVSSSGAHFLSCRLAYGHLFLFSNHFFSLLLCRRWNDSLNTGNGTDQYSNKDHNLRLLLWVLTISSSKLSQTHVGKNASWGLWRLRVEFGQAHFSVLDNLCTKKEGGCNNQSHTLTR